MKSAVNDRRFLSNIFHDVDLAAVRPASSTNIVTQHPERRPDALAVRDFDSRFKPSVGLAEFILGKQSCRSVVASYVIRAGESFLNCFDYELATVLIRVYGSTRIVLKFVVAPAVAADIKGQFAGINRRAIGAVELVAPNQAPYRRITRVRYRARSDK